VRSKKVRFTSSFVVLAAALAVSGLIAPGVSAAEIGDLQVEFVEGHQPAHAIKNQLITAVPFDPSPGDVEFPGPFVEVHVTRYNGDTFENLAGAQVTFRLAVGDGLAATADVHFETRTTDVLGVARFDPQEGSATPLSIGAPNEATFTDYELVPLASELEGSPTEGSASGPFDIWGARCHSTDGCSLTLNNGVGSDSYTTSDQVLAVSSVSQAQNVLPELSCPGQRLIFGGNLFVHATNGTGAVSLTSIITKADFRAAGTNYGQAHVEWCLGLEDSSAWVHNGASFTSIDMDGDDIPDIFVASAPKCPKKKNASTFAPCIVSQVSDGKGGSISKGYLPGGDPPRRT
jgi:hypothetical protein